MIASDQFINSAFQQWVSATVANPKNGFVFCRDWFVTSVTRGRPMDIALEPLDAKGERGARLLLQNPPEQIRLWHSLPDGVVEARKHVVRVRVRGLPAENGALQLDSMALFNGSDDERKVDRRLTGVVPLSPVWHEFAVPLKSTDAPLEGRRYLTLRFSGRGVVEIDFCRIQEAAASVGVFSSARELAAKVLAGLRSTTPVEPTAEDSRERLSLDAPLKVSKVEVAEVPVIRSASPQALDATGNSNLLRNSGFHSWAGDQLEAWQVALPRGVGLKRTAPSRDQPFKAPGVSISFDKPAPDQAVTIAQRVVGLASEQYVDVVVVGKAEKRTIVEIVLTNASGAVLPGSKVSATLWPSWQFHTANIRLPAKLGEGQYGIALIVAGGQSRTVNLAYVTACVAGQKFTGQYELRETPSIASNAVVNGRFDHWQGPLAQNLTTRRIEITDEWQLAAKQPNPALETRLTEISPRGLRDGRDHPSVPGIALQGQIVGPYLRMEATLDVLQMFAGPPRQLRFYARGASTSLAAPGRERPVIQQIFIAERVRLSPEKNEHDVKRLFTLRRNIRIGSIGELHTLPLRADQRALLAAKVKETIRDPGRSLSLIFEFADTIDIAIGDVRLGNDGSPADVLARQAADGAAMEDPNITGQLMLLKGLDLWRSGEPLSATPYSPQSASVDPPHWSWLPGSKMTVDIVICVYNAVEETLDCLESIRRHTTIPHTVTVIDDKSTDVTREQLRRYVQGKPWIRLFENDVNLGYTRSANIGMSSSTAEWVVLLNSDTIVTPGWLEGMFEVVQAKPKAAMVGPLSNAASWQSVPSLHDVKGGWSSNPLPEGFSPVDVARLVRELSPQQFPEATLLNGFCTLMRRSVIEEVGYLDEAAFPMGYGEENDLCLRVRKAGYSLVLADHVYVYHVKSASFGSARRAELSKRGTASLLAKHPDVDMKAIQRDMAELTSLIELRKRLRKVLHPEIGQREMRPPEKPMKAVSPGIVSSQLH